MVVFASGCSQPDPSEELKPLVERYIAAWNTGNFDGLENAVSKDFELRMTPQFNPLVGIDTLKNSITYWRTAYPDFKITLDEVIYTKEKVAARWTIRATNTGPGFHPPTGRTVVVPGISILHISESKIVDEWIAGNELYWMQQLGFNLTPPDNSK